MRGAVVEVESPEHLVASIVELRRLGYRRLEAHSPYPVEAAEEALGLPRPRVARWTLLGGIAGAIAGYGVQYWTAVEALPVNAGGFPLHSAPSFVPVAFETMILVAAIATVAGLFAATRLPALWHPAFEVEGFERATIDRFFLFIDAADPAFDVARTRAELDQLPAVRVQLVPGQEGRWAPPPELFTGLLLLAMLNGACNTQNVLVAPELSLERMIDQRKAEAFEESPVFEDGRAMRSPPVGTVPRTTEAWVPGFELGHEGGRYLPVPPVQVTRELLERGRGRFEIFCAACHGIQGDGASAVARRMALVKPRDLHLPEVRRLPAGRVYRVIREGVGLMPSLEGQLDAKDRWAVVAYVRALQLSRAVPLSKLPAELRREAEGHLQ